MNRKRIGSIVLLIVLVGIAGIFYLINRDTDTEPDVVFEPPSDEVIEQIQTDIAERNAQDADKTPSPGEKEETGHRHADGTWHEGAHDTTSEAFKGTLTYHKELLQTNPVEALRQQAIERGHWSARWIPPFPPDDVEAQTFARNTYLSEYYDEGTPEFEKAVRAQLRQLKEINNKYPYGARRLDLKKITWAIARSPVAHYNVDGTAIYPSDYFPHHISDLR